MARAQRCFLHLLRLPAEQAGFSRSLRTAWGVVSLLGAQYRTVVWRRPREMEVLLRLARELKSPSGDKVTQPRAGGRVLEWLGFTARGVLRAQLRRALSVASVHSSSGTGPSEGETVLSVKKEVEVYATSLPTTMWVLVFESGGAHGRVIARRCEFHAVHDSR